MCQEKSAYGALLAFIRIMKLTNIGLFRHLLRDLGVNWLPVEIPTPGRLAALRMQLLASAEANTTFNPYDREKHEATYLFNEKWNECFSPSLKELDILEPKTFRNVYQILSFQLKIPTPTTESQKYEYIEKFLKNEASCRSFRVDRTNPLLRMTRKLVRFFCHDLDISPERIAENLRHGPGSVFNRERGEDKNFLDPVPEILARHFPEDLFFSDPLKAAEEAKESFRKTKERFVTARLALVSKDYKGPRGVFVSPKEAMMHQLGCLAVLTSHVERTFLGDIWVTRSQARSQEFASWGSATRDWLYTLDLSDASDLISNQLVAYLFPRDVYLALSASRPHYLELPFGVRHRMCMFAPMGDGKTFPVLSIICSCITLAASLIHDGYLPTWCPQDSTLREYAKLIAVTGDDIAGHSRYYATVRKSLILHGLKVNDAKSFQKGLFREACGNDSVRGLCCTPIRQKVDLESEEDDDALIKLIELHNRMRVDYPHMKVTWKALRNEILRRNDRVGFTTQPSKHPLRLYDPTFSRVCDFLNSVAPMEFKNHGKAAFWDFVYCNRFGNLFAVNPWNYRYNPQLCRWEVKCLTMKEAINYRPHVDARWRYNYVMLTSRQDSIPPPYAASRKVRIIGSPVFDRFVRNLAVSANVIMSEPSESLLVTRWQGLT